MKCRYDWHQTASHVTVAIYAKKYSDTESYVEVNPVRFVIVEHFNQQHYTPGILG